MTAKIRNGFWPFSVENDNKKNFFLFSSPAEHHERYYLYLIISVTIGVLLCLIIITGRIIIQKQQDDVEDSSKDEPKFHKSSTGETTITKGFSGDNICDMEGGDIDLTTPMGMGNLPVKNEVIVMSLLKAASVINGKIKLRTHHDDKCLCFIALLCLLLMYSCHRCFMNLCFMSFFLSFFVCLQKSSFNTYAPSLAPYVSIVPTSSSAMLIRAPSAIQQQQASSILIGSGGLNNNPSILAQSPSNLGKQWLAVWVVYASTTEGGSGKKFPFHKIFLVLIINNQINIH